jgi:uncharacterized membrane protein
MIELAAAALLFVGSHFLVSSTGARPWLVARLGQRLYLGLYSLVAILLFAGFSWHYGAAPFVAVWSPPSWFALVPLAVVPFALILLVGGVSAPNPTAVLGPRQAADDPRGVFALTRHPVMWAIGLWALSHLAANGDGASMIFFGSLAFLALGGTLAIERRKRAAWEPKQWDAFAAATSNLPLVAIMEGRARFTVADLGWWRIALAVLIYALLIGAHPHVIGVPVWAW